jgi:TRAP-type C4-dicarboxylate transport system permease large subunit
MIDKYHFRCHLMSISKILVPEMTKRGYSAAFSTAITAASSAIAPVIPPGINLIIYALIAQTSVAKMFISGYVPGILMCVALMLTVNLISKKRGYLPTREKMSPPRDILIQLKEYCLFNKFCCFNHYYRQCFRTIYELGTYSLSAYKISYGFFRITMAHAYNYQYYDRRYYTTIWLHDVYNLFHNKSISW